jgi:hypothetical protein
VEEDVRLLLSGSVVFLRKNQVDLVYSRHRRSHVMHVR